MIGRVFGVGAVASMGLDARQVAACARARKLAPGPLSIGRDEGVCRAALDDALVSFDRLVALGALALEEAAAALPHGTVAPMLLALAEPGRGVDDTRLGPALASAVAVKSGVAIDHDATRTFRLGAAGFAFALEDAHALLSADPTRYVFVGGIDSHIDPSWLAELARSGSLHGIGVRAGFVPSEGAAFVLLGGEHAPGDPLAILTAASTCSPAARDLEQDTREMAEMLRRVAPGGVAWVMSDVNGEAWRVIEWAALEAEAGLGHAVRQRLPDRLGDVGAATGALALATICLDLAERAAEASEALVVLASHGPLRGAFVVRSSSRVGAEAPLTSVATYAVAERKTWTSQPSGPAKEFLRRLARDAVEDVASLGSLRSPGARELWSPELARFEVRLVDNLRALAALAASRRGHPEILDAVEAWVSSSPVPDPGRHRARALVLGSFAGSAWAHEAAAGIQRAPRRARAAVVEGLALAPNVALGLALAAAARATDPEIATAAFEVLADRHDASAVAISIALERLDDADSRVRAAAARCARISPSARLPLERRLGVETDEAALVACATALLMHGAASGLAVARARLDAARNATGIAWARLVAVAGDASDSERIGTSFEFGAEAAIALGAHGHLDHVERLASGLSRFGANDGGLVARALARLTGLALPASDAAGALVDAFRGARGLPNARYRGGILFEPRQMLRELEGCEMSGDERALAELELAIAVGAPTDFFARDWVPRQLAALSALDPLLEARAVGSWPLLR